MFRILYREEGTAGFGGATKMACHDVTLHYGSYPARTPPARDHFCVQVAKSSLCTHLRFASFSAPAAVVAAAAPFVVALCLAILISRGG